MDVEAPYGLVKSNPTALTILLGKETDSFLDESVLQAMTTDPKPLAEWRMIRKEVMLLFHKGAYVINTTSGARSFVSNHYFSIGAKELFTGGVRMMGLTDVLSYEFN